MTAFESYNHALACAAEAVVARRKAFWVAVNPEKIHTALGNPELKRVLYEASAGLCDGIGVSIAARLIHGRSLARCTGCDMFFRLIGRAAEEGWGVFLLGASPGSNEKAAAVLMERHPSLRIVGRRDGYFDDAADVVREINASGADMLFVAMGSPRQEFWISEHREAIEAPFCMGVGGSLDVASGQAPRAPRWLQRLGLEYVYQVLFRPGWSLGTRWRRTGARLGFMMRVLAAALSGRGGEA